MIGDNGVMAAPIALVKFQFKGDQYSKAVKAEMARRLNRATQYLETKVQLNISVPKDLIGPMPTPAEFPRAISRQLGRSIYAEVDAENLIGHVGAGRQASKALAAIILSLEFGARGDVRITPKLAKALKIPVTQSEAQAITNRFQTYRRKGPAGPNSFQMRPKRGARDLMKRAGIIRIRGQLYVLRMWAMRGPVRQKSFLRRTLHEERLRLVGIMCAPLPAGLSGGVGIEVATGMAQNGSGDMVPMWGGEGGFGLSK
jgi:hypothetical protein